MATAVIAYSTGRGHTLRLAQAVAEGMRHTPGVSPFLMDTAALSAEDWQCMHDAEAIIFGSPTYMGGVSAGFKTFMDDSSDYWEERRWLDKIAAGFTIGTNYSGDKLMTLQNMAVFAAQHGMIWVGQAVIGPRPVPGGERQVDGERPIELEHVVDKEVGILEDDEQRQVGGNCNTDHDFVVR